MNFYVFLSYSKHSNLILFFSSHLVNFWKNLFFFGGLGCPPLWGGQTLSTKFFIDHTFLLIVLTWKLDIMDGMPNKDFWLNSWLNWMPSCFFIKKIVILQLLYFLKIHHFNAKFSKISLEKIYFIIKII